MLIKTEDLTFVYGHNLAWEKVALDKVSITINKNEHYGILGGTGSGKSTLVQHFNGLLVPTSGSVYIKGVSLNSNEVLKKIKREVGLVFQFPEQQIFGETVREELSYGLKNFNFLESEIDLRIKESLYLVGLKPESILQRNPYNLSGGEKRRVALASILSMKPSILVLDEPFAGIDSGCRNLIISSLKKYAKKNDATLIIVSHRIEEILSICSKGVVLKEGKVIFEGSISDLLSSLDVILEAGIEPPFFTRLYQLLKQKGFNLLRIPTNAEEFIDEIRKCLV